MAARAAVKSKTKRTTPSRTRSAPASALELRIVPIGTVKAAKDNVRSDLGDLSEMVSSMKAVGVLEPLLVTPSSVSGASHPGAPPRNGELILVAGARRLAAAKKAGLKTVPVVVRPADDDQARLEVMLIENLQRADIPPLDEAAAYRRLVDDFGYSQAKVAQRVGKTGAHVSRRLALLVLPDKARDALTAGKIALTDAVELTKLNGDPKRQASALKEGTAHRYASVSDAVDRELMAVSREKERQAKIEKLKAQGIRVLTPSEVKAATPVRHYGSPLTHVDPDKHRKGKCAAVTIDQHGYINDFCLEPDRHPQPKEAAERAQRISKADLHREALAAAAKTRMEFLKSLLGMLGKPEASETLARAVVFGDPEPSFWDAAQALGILEPDADELVVDDVHAVRSYAARGLGELGRASLALALTALDPGVFSGYGRLWNEEPTPWYFELLERHGYSPTSAERLELAGKGPR